jgi:beta-glucosidase
MKATEIINTLSLEDKIKLITGKEFWYTQPLEKYGLKSLLLTDGPSGIRKQSEGSDALGLNKSIETIAFPGLALVASSFNKKLLNNYGELLGIIAKSEGVNILLGPGVNIKRNPFGGRNFEYMSEDPFLAGTLAAEYVKGVESQGVGTSVKHFVANNRENQRFSNSSNIDMRALREIYLKPFEIITKKAQPASIMSSYNLLNHVYVSENSWLLTDILRNEWNYNGLIVSDWAAIKNRTKALKAGLDLEMPGKGDYTVNELKIALQNGDINENLLNKSVERVINTIQKYQLDSTSESYNKEELHQAAKEIADESTILLKNNDNILPLKTKSFSIIGDLAENPRFQGGGSSKVNPYKVISPLESLHDNINHFAKGYNINDEISNDDLLKEAVNIAENEENIVVFLGYPEHFEGEGYDKTTLNLPNNQVELLRALYKVNQNIIVVLQNGGIVLMPWENETKAIIETYLPGEAVGESIKDILLGTVNPSGKLAETIPKYVEDIPSYYSFNKSKTEENYLESIFVGYRHYDTKNIDVQFPFGHGLSYSDFKYSNLKVSKNTNKLDIQFDITNTSAFSGVTVPQIYIKNNVSDIEMPKKELKAFERVYLKDNETKTIEVSISFADLRWFNVQTNLWEFDYGHYDIFIAESVSDIRLKSSVNITNEELDNISDLITGDTYLYEIIERKNEIHNTLKKYEFDKMISNVEQDDALAPLFKNMPLRSLIMLNIDFNDINNFIDEANEEIAQLN